MSTERNLAREALLRKIRALRQMTTARGATEHEASLAATHLAKLISEYQITEDELTLKEDAQGCVADAVRIIRTDRPAWFKCGGAISKLFKTQCWSSHKYEDLLGLGTDDCVRSLNFYGFPEDVAASCAMMDIIDNACLNEGLAYAKSRGKPSRGRAAKQANTATRESFSLGLADRLSDMIRALLPAQALATGTALIVLKDQLVTDRFAEYLRTKNINLHTSRAAQPVDPAAYAAGQRAAANVNLRPGPQVASATHRMVGG